MSPPRRDELARAVLDHSSLRVVVATTTAVTAEAARRHGAVGGVVAALGRAATAGLLLATITKDDERVTVQLLGGGPIGAVLVDADASGAVRATVKHPTLAIPALPRARVSLAHAVGAHGVVRVSRDLGLREIVTGQTALLDGEIDRDVEHYLNASEQITSAMVCETLLGDDLDVVASAGVLLQTLPGSEAVPLLERLRDRLRAGGLSRALAGGPPTGAAALARTVLGDEAEGLTVLDVRPVRFACRCSRERAAATLVLLGAGELAALALAEEDTVVTCDFCRERHVFSRPEIESLRAEVPGRETPRA